MEKLINDFSFGLFFWVAIIFTVLIFILRKFAWKPILSSLDEREEGIQGALDAAENAKKELENLQADNERILNEARAERDGLLKEAREMKANILAKAEEEATVQTDKMISKAKEVIAAEKKAAVADLKNQVAGLSVEIAEKVVKNELSDKDKQLALVETLLKDATLN